MIPAICIVASLSILLYGWVRHVNRHAIPESKNAHLRRVLGHEPAEEHRNWRVLPDAEEDELEERRRWA